MHGDSESAHAIRLLDYAATATIVTRPPSQASLHLLLVSFIDADVLLCGFAGGLCAGLRADVQTLQRQSGARSECLLFADCVLCLLMSLLKNQMVAVAGGGLSAANGRRAQGVDCEGRAHQGTRRDGAVVLPSHLGWFPCSLFARTRRAKHLRRQRRRRRPRRAKSRRCCCSHVCGRVFAVLVVRTLRARTRRCGLRALREQRQSRTLTLPARARTPPLACHSICGSRKSSEQSGRGFRCRTFTKAKVTICVALSV